MDTRSLIPQQVESEPAASPGRATPLSVNAMRLNSRQWLVVVVIVLACFLGVPRLWKWIERFETGPDYRIPYALSDDYWLYQRRLEGIDRIPPEGGITSADPLRVPVLGDSVIWGEYVRAEGTLSHFLSKEMGQPGRFLNCGVNGLFPLAMEGLVENYAGALRDRPVIVHCNPLWMTSPKADLSTTKEEKFNHSRLVPQFSPRIPCYREDTAARLGVVVDRNVDFFAWVEHLDIVCFGGKSIPRWTLDEDDSQPPRCPNAWRNPLAQVTLTVPGEPSDDPDRGPRSKRHRPWTEGGGEPTTYDWVPLDRSLQWQAFQRAVTRLRGRGCDVLVIVGPFNEWMIAPEQRSVYGKLRDGIAMWLRDNRFAFVVPKALPSELYADASHPLTEGYALLAKEIGGDAAFKKWYNPK